MHNTKTLIYSTRKAHLEGTVIELSINSTRSPNINVLKGESIAKV